MWSYYIGHEFSWVSEWSFSATHKNMHIDNWKVFQLGFIEFTYQHLVTFFIGTTKYLFELLYKLHVLVDDHGSNYNTKNLGGVLFNLFDEFVSFHQNSVYGFWVDLLCCWGALKIV